eukprot:9315330-Ditylum_brightwellii.AAC.1
MAWLQIKAKSECSTGLSDNLTFIEEENKHDNNEEEEDSKDLLAPNMAQTIPTMSVSRKKSVIELINKESNSKPDS